MVKRVPSWFRAALRLAFVPAAAFSTNESQVTWRIDFRRRPLRRDPSEFRCRGLDTPHRLSRRDEATSRVPSVLTSAQITRQSREGPTFIGHS